MSCETKKQLWLLTRSPKQRTNRRTDMEHKKEQYDARLRLNRFLFLFIISIWFVCLTVVNCCCYCITCVTYMIIWSNKKICVYCAAVFAVDNPFIDHQRANQRASTKHSLVELAANGCGDRFNFERRIQRQFCHLNAWSSRKTARKNWNDIISQIKSSASFQFDQNKVTINANQ